MSADLHCHSKCSDGATDVETLVKIAKLGGLHAIALTDHDTFMGIDKAKACGEKYGVQIIEGVEISAYDFERKRLVHILCYNCKHPEKFEKLFGKIGESRSSKMIEAMKEISKHYAIDLAMVEKVAQDSSTIFKSHIMQTLMLAGYTDKVYGDLYKKIFDWKTGFARTKIEYPDMFEVVDTIHSAGGTAILAHPSVYDTIPAIPRLIKAGIDGIECSYPRGSQEIQNQLRKIVEDNNLLETGGTDFHGYSSSSIYPLGTCTTSNENLRKLMQYKR